MKLHSILLSGLVLLRAGIVHADVLDNTIDTNSVCDERAPEPGSEDFPAYARNCRGVNAKPGARPVVKVKKVNCEALLKPETSCTGLSHKACKLRGWLRAGCQKAPECSNIQNPKKCCDNRDILPFGSGIYYEGYMRACAPQYKLKKNDHPEFKSLTCDKINSFSCGLGIGKGFCDMRSWEDAGCQQAAKCVNRQDDLAKCCDEWPNKPDRFFKKTYLQRYTMKCMGK